MRLNNPYHIGGRIPVDSDMFFGREREIKSIEKMLSGNTPQCVSIIGERRIGKSSLAYRVYQGFKNTENTLAVYLDCDEISESSTSADEFFGLLNQRFSDSLADNPKINKHLIKDGKDLFYCYSSFKTFLRQIARQGTKSIIFLDEFEHLPANLFADDLFFSNLRAVAGNPDNLLAFITISKSELKTLTHHSIRTSGFWNIFMTEVIGLLDHASIESLRKKGFHPNHLSLNDEEIERIHYYASDNPFLNQVACSFAWDSKINNKELKWDNLEVELFPFYEKLWEDSTREEQKLLKLSIGGTLKSIFVLKQMENRGLLVKKEKYYFPFSAFFPVIIKNTSQKKINLKGTISKISSIFKFLFFRETQPLTTDEKTKEIPYGLSDFTLMQKGNYYYVDRTRYIRKLEEAGRYLFFIRPRRFGKSLFISMLETYYDITGKKEFPTFFKGTDIFIEPTEDRNSYLVLKFNFSSIDPSFAEISGIKRSFLNYVKTVCISFLSKYAGYLKRYGKQLVKKIEEKESASDILIDVITLCRESQQRVYLMIDEYDNFANTILSGLGTRDYKEVTQGIGFFRAFFNAVKEGATGSGAPISRLFITGVSPITMDDVTSGFNIGENITTDPAFNQMLGFNHADVRRMLEYYKPRKNILHSVDFLMRIMGEWYNNYRFTRHARELLYNSDMVLYFIKEYIKVHNIPDELIDNNARTDYGKLRYLMMVDMGKSNQTNGNFSKLKEIIENGEIESKLVKAFSVEKLLAPENFISLLFYHGLLTVNRDEKDKLVLKIPNETTKRLYYEYIKEGYVETDIFSLDLYHYSKLMTEMAYDGKWIPLFEYIAGLMCKSMSLRDLITGEKSIQAFLNVYLGLSELYIIHSERELNLGYGDIVMEPFIAKYEDIKYSYILEIKYVKKGLGAKAKNKLEETINLLKGEAESQLKKYSDDERFGKTIEKTNLIRLVLIFKGNELVYRGKIKKERRVKVK